MDIPVCPNHKEKRCERSELRLMGENDQAFLFHCTCCKLIWAVSKPREKASARWVNRMKQVKQLTEAEREASARPKVSGPYYMGVTHQ